MAERTIEGTRYRSGTMNAMTQFRVAKRLLPILGPLMKAAKAGQSGEEGGLEVFMAAAEAIADLPDSDTDYILAQCLAVVSRESGPGWADIWNRQADRLAYDDISLPAMLQLAGMVIMENLGGFFPALPSASSGGASPVPTSMP